MICQLTLWSYNLWMMSYDDLPTHNSSFAPSFYDILFGTRQYLFVHLKLLQPVTLFAVLIIFTD